MRIWAWHNQLPRHDLGTDRWKTEDPIRCDAWCGGPDRRRLQRERRCTRPDFRGTWTRGEVPVPLRVGYWGREAIGEVGSDGNRHLRVIEGEEHNIKDERLEVPSENWAEGCPKGWMLTEWTASLVPYMRPRDGGRPNPRIHELTDLAVEALLYYEHEQDRAVAEYYRVRDAARDAARRNT